MYCRQKKTENEWSHSRRNCAREMPTLRAMILIQADLGVNEVDAAKAYRSSREYGNTFFDDVDDQILPKGISWAHRKA
jgi:hypothetical protein